MHISKLATIKVISVNFKVISVIVSKLEGVGL